ncbi:MAG: Maf family protein [Nitrospirae bacterium]|nr:Maf family protein [Nitrospirota bacterium]
MENYTLERIYTNVLTLPQSRIQIKNTKINIFAMRKIILASASPLRKEINAYIRSKEPLNKAGAYAIQRLGSIFITKRLKK